VDSLDGWAGPVADPVPVPVPSWRCRSGNLPATRGCNPLQLYAPREPGCIQDISPSEADGGTHRCAPPGREMVWAPTGPTASLRRAAGPLPAAGPSRAGRGPPRRRSGSSPTRCRAATSAGSWRARRSSPMPRRPTWSCGWSPRRPPAGSAECWSRPTASGSRPGCCAPRSAATPSATGSGPSSSSSPSHLKHRYGWDRTRMDGIDGARIWCGHGVLAHNLVKISGLIEAKQAR
jgi:hypothetical protein